MDKFFKITERGSTVRTEILAGITTFMTMAYVLVVQPASIVGFGPEAYLTDINGVMISRSAIMITCAIVSGLITLMMAFYANLPFALSTGMGTNFLLGALIQSGQYSFGWAMSVIMVSGVIFLVLSIFGIRDIIVRMIPKNIKVAISTVIGFFLIYLGFNNTGIGVFKDGISMGDFKQPAVWLALLGIVIISVLTAFKVRGAILIGIVAITLLGIPLGVTTVPTTFLSLPDFGDISNILFYFDLKGMFTAGAIVWVFIAFFGDFFSTLGTVLGVAQKAGMLDEEGNLPEIHKPFIVDAVGTCVGAAAGCTTITTYVESSAGVEEGGRTGLTAMTTGLLFLICIFASPLFLMIPNAATGPALIFVGFLMMSGFSEINFSDFSDAFGPFIMIAFGTYTANIATGISAGILAHVAIKLFTGKFKEVHPGLYILCIPLILYFVLG